jgi:hypothetical protein
MIKIYDIETFPNFFSYIDIDTKTAELNEFVICAWRDDSEAFIKHIKAIDKAKGGMVGFNNVHFDWPVTNFIYNMLQPTAEKIYDYAQSIIRDEVPKRQRAWIKQLDLFLLNHYNNKARSASLKSLEVSLNWHNVMDMPFHYTHIVLPEETEAILEYNRNDVLFTLEFYKQNKDKIKMRKAIGSKYKMNISNKSDVDIGEEIFVKYLSNAMDTDPYQLKQIRGKRANVPLKNIIFDYISFKHPALNKLLETMRLTVASPNYLDDFISNLNMSMSTNDLQDILNANHIDINKTVSKKKSFSFQTRYANLLIDYGVGGIHSCIAPGVYKSDDDLDILDIDVKSYYPNLFIKNKLHPRQMDQNTFVKVYSDIFQERVKAQKEGDELTSDALKLALNGLFGKTGSDVSCFYDPNVFYAVTVNGQLLITMLLEKLYTIGCEVLQINTDGITIRHHKDQKEALIQACHEWESETQLTLEYANYKQMIIRDVNNYIAENINGKVKEKGIFETKKDWHKDNSFMVIPIAVRNYFINGTPIIETLSKHRNIYDFCGRYKASPGWRAVHVELHKDNKNKNTIEFGKILRFLPVKKGGFSLKRNLDGREHYLLAGFPTIPFNVKCEIKKKELNYEYFVAQCMKLIQTVKPLQISLLSI